MRRALTLRTSPYLPQMQLTYPWCSSNSKGCNKKQWVEYLTYAVHHYFFSFKSQNNDAPNLPHNVNKCLVRVHKIMQGTITSLDATHQPMVLFTFHRM